MTRPIGSSVRLGSHPTMHSMSTHSRTQSISSHVVDESWEDSEGAAVASPTMVRLRAMAASAMSHFAGITAGDVGEYLGVFLTGLLRVCQGPAT